MVIFIYLNCKSLLIKSSHKIKSKLNCQKKFSMLQNGIHTKPELCIKSGKITHLQDKSEDVNATLLDKEKT